MDYSQEWIGIIVKVYYIENKLMYIINLQELSILNILCLILECSEPLSSRLFPPKAISS